MINNVKLAVRIFKLLPNQVYSGFLSSSYERCYLRNFLIFKVLHYYTTIKSKPFQLILYEVTLTNFQ